MQAFNVIFYNRDYKTNSKLCTQKTDQPWHPHFKHSLEDIYMITKEKEKESLNRNIIIKLIIIFVECSI